MVNIIAFILYERICINFKYYRVWKGFKNSARRDGAIFKHWIRADDKAEGNIYMFKFII